jgi:hypothetical protein
MAAAAEQYDAYLKKTAALGTYRKAYRDYAFETMAGKKITTREKRVLELLAQHVGYYSEQREIKTEKWRAAYDNLFTQFDE